MQIREICKQCKNKGEDDLCDLTCKSCKVKNEDAGDDCVNVSEKG